MAAEQKGLQISCHSQNHCPPVSGNRDLGILARGQDLHTIHQDSKHLKMRACLEKSLYGWTLIASSFSTVLSHGIPFKSDSHTPRIIPEPEKGAGLEHWAQTALGGIGVPAVIDRMLAIPGELSDPRCLYDPFA